MSEDSIETAKLRAVQTGQQSRIESLERRVRVLEDSDIKRAADYRNLSRFLQDVNEKVNGLGRQLDAAQISINDIRGMFSNRINDVIAAYQETASHQDFDSPEEITKPDNHKPAPDA